MLSPLDENGVQSRNLSLGDRHNEILRDPAPTIDKETKGENRAYFVAVGREINSFLKYDKSTSYIGKLIINIA